MNEKRLSRMVKYKLDITEKFLDRMPEKMSAEFKNNGSVILKIINENVQAVKEHSPEKAKASDKLNHVPIE
jgi:hypothetical protein